MSRYRRTRVVVFAWAMLSGLALTPWPAHSEPSVSPTAKDPHYTDAGCFDVHVCHWPDRPVFLMSLFSSTQYKQLRRVEVFRPDDKLLTTLDLTRYNVVTAPGKPEKRVFIAQTPLPADAGSGWYYARVTLADGRKIVARDYVEIDRLGQANAGLNPPPGATHVALPRELSWAPVPEARHYKVYLRDQWDGGRLIFESKLLNEPRVALPDGLLQPEGLYSWRIHARDVNEDPRLGDFNHGSLSIEAEFSVAPAGR